MKAPDIACEWASKRLYKTPSESVPEQLIQKFDSQTRTFSSLVASLWRRTHNLSNRTPRYNVIQQFGPNPKAMHVFEGTKPVPWQRGTHWKNTKNPEPHQNPLLVEERYKYMISSLRNASNDLKGLIRATHTKQRRPQIQSPKLRR